MRGIIRRAGLVGRGRRLRLLLLALLLTASMMGARVALPSLATPAAAQGTTALWGWGSNSAGQVGDGSTTDRGVPVQVVDLPSNDTVVAFSAGGNHSLALTAAGQVWAWGLSQQGQLGNPNTTETCPFGPNNPCSTTPVQVQGLPSNDPVEAVSAGGFDSLALTASGHVWAWGLNDFGQLGNPNTTDTCTAGFFGNPGGPCSRTPVPVIGLPTNDPVKAIAATGGFGRHSLAVTASGHVYAWGDNRSGQLGNGTLISSTTPVLVATLPPDVVAVAGGFDFSLALTASGQVWAWGLNPVGQLGAGITFDSPLPVPVCTTAPTASAACGGMGLPADDPVVAISVGRVHSLALTKSGQVWAWGFNDNGQLGDGSTSTSRIPVQVQGLPGPATQVSAGAFFSLALLADGHIYSWGRGLNGELGDGTFNNPNPTPRAVLGPPTTEQVIAIAAGGFDPGHGMALTRLNPTLQLSKALSGSRVGPNDQFTVQIKDSSGNVVSDPTHATTAGSGPTITEGTGTTGVFTATAQSTYHLTEVGADGTSLSDYTKTISCTDANGVQMGLPQDVVFEGSFAITPEFGAAISCTITNTAAPTPTPTTTPTPTPTAPPKPTPTATPAPGTTPTPPPGLPGLPNTGARPRRSGP